MTLGAAIAVLAVAGGALGRQLTEASMNQKVVNMQYAVLGDIVEEGEKTKAKLKNPSPDEERLMFDQVIEAHIGNPQALGQKAPPFNRQVMSLVTNPVLIETAPDAFLPQAIERAQSYLARITGGIGAYSEPQGLAVIRNEVAAFLKKRDGFAADTDNVFLTNGASDAVRLIMNALIRGPGAKDGVMLPVPQDPMYSAQLTLSGGETVGYYLDEDWGWSTKIKELKRAADKAAGDGIAVRAIVVTNPGNPVGKLLSADVMKDIVRFCKTRGLVLLADEVYQDNLYGAARGKFVSFKKVVMEMGDEAAGVELISFHSTSNGFLGEGGVRGGYMELHNIDPAVSKQILKFMSVSICPNVMGQIGVGLMVNPPTDGLAGSMHRKHRESVMVSLERRAKKLNKALNALTDVSVTAVEGSMYAFPKVKLPKAIDEVAKMNNKQPDEFYCLAMLGETGIMAVPGAGFNQKEGTFHFRISILTPEDQLDNLIARIHMFHEKFMDFFADGEFFGGDETGWDENGMPEGGYPEGAGGHMEF
jgi:aspartate/methionine/tyrosine aminotransferase